ncbi:hypothetical protein [Brevibacillus laterosporus]|uniref:hypothetical protein n=1 Tax=Brevibacillus laterosporus TaxID=1465 RepID=UPI0021581A8D|nr:hypothetical protein [Brevibacillus laterosporus]MED1665958.1 hypothetical protein [Brevibacillus laterosporus]MED1667359.1 hypothetical protein [Brevibacillus laterosporus]MED1717217.1 hypothetical protein [Brevibacillus laterosporus]
MSSNQVLEVKMNLHRELNSFKEETKEDIRDINLSIKQSEKLFNGTIVTMTENIPKLTTIAGQQREDMLQQREEIRLIRESKSSETKTSQGNDEKKWYQETTNKLIMLIGLIICVLLGLNASAVNFLK